MVREKVRDTQGGEMRASEREREREMKSERERETQREQLADVIDR